MSHSKDQETGAVRRSTGNIPKKANMGKGKFQWSFSNHPVSDVRDWADNGLLELRPDFQRREVWSEPARAMLIDTILRNFPMPKVYLQARIGKDQKTYRAVIDGQQRLGAILDYLRGKFVLDLPEWKTYRGRPFKKLPPSVQDRILGYKIDMNEVFNASEEELREMYLRVNKYTRQLNKQELRRADFPGEFLELAEKLALNEYLDAAGVFAMGDRRRMGDTEFVSELLAALLAGPQDKKGTLDNFYQQNANWRSSARDAVERRFLAVLADLQIIFGQEYPIRRTRFSQKSDFYSLFLAIDDLHKSGLKLPATECSPLREDLSTLDQNIAPTAGVALLAEYAVKCVSDANSGASRSWRKEFMLGFLDGTYRQLPPRGDAATRMREILVDLMTGDDMCPAQTIACPGCGVEFDDYSVATVRLVWSPTESVFQMSNAQLAHGRCLKRPPLAKWKREHES